MFNQNNSQQSARYGVNPFQIYTISLGPNIDRSQGQIFPEPQGVGMYIECADYPVQISLVNVAGGPAQSLVARDGLQVEAFFKGFQLTHPSINVPAVLKLITFASPDAVLVNQLAQPLTRLPLSYAQTVGTGTNASFAIYVPPGVRALNQLQIVAAGATVTGAFAQPQDASGNPFSGATNIQQQVGAAIIAYTQSNTVYFAVGNVQGSNIIAGFGPVIPLPPRCVQVVVSLVGTGFSGAGVGLTGYFT